MFNFINGTFVELYRFIHRNEVITVTSSDSPVNFNNEDYSPISIKRTDYSVTTQNSRAEIKITTSHKFEVVDFFRSITPDDINVEIYRVDIDSQFQESNKIFSGLVKSLDMKQNVAEFTLQPFASLLTRDICRYSYQTLCNNSLYDSNCKLNIEDHSLQTTGSLDPDGITFTLDIPNQSDPAVWQNGLLRINRTGEARMIIESNNNIVKVISPFTDFQEGDIVKVSKGCNRGSEQCKTRFNNFNNFAGFEYIPNRDPYQNGL